MLSLTQTVKHDSCLSVHALRSSDLSKRCIAVADNTAVTFAKSLNMDTIFQTWLKKHYACEPALNWLGDRDPETAWRECPRADWMLWAAGRLDVDRKTQVTIACRIARKVLHLVPAGEDRPRIAIETTERWVRGEATIEEVQVARRNAYAAADVAADAAADAAAAPALALLLTRPAIHAARAAAKAATTEAAAYAREQMQHECADIVREVLPWETIKDLYNKELEHADRTRY